MMRNMLMLAVVASLAACAPPNPGIVFLPSKKSAVELRAVQTRVIPGDADSVMRDVIATLHDLGYRITKAEPGAGTVSGTRQTALSMAVVVQPRSPRESVVRANAFILSFRQEAQVDSPEFFTQNFFNPLGALTQRTLAALPDDATAPEPVRPAAERNAAKERRAAAQTPAGSQPPTQEPTTPQTTSTGSTTPKTQAASAPSTAPITPPATRTNTP